MCKACTNNPADQAKWYDDRGLAGPEIEWEGQPLNYKWYMTVTAVGLVALLLLELLVFACTREPEVDDDSPAANQMPPGMETALSVYSDDLLLPVGIHIRLGCPTI